MSIEILGEERPRSVAVVYWWDFLDAVKAAKFFTCKERPYVRVDLRRESNGLVLSAMAPCQMATVEAFAQWLDIRSEDSWFELSLSDIKKLVAHFPYRRKPDCDLEDQPLIELHFTQDKVFFFDATGLNLHLYRFYVLRNLEPEVPAGVPRLIGAALGRRGDIQTVIQPWQMDAISRACTLLKRNPKILPIEPDSAVNVGKSVALAGSLSVLSAVMRGDHDIEPGVEEQLQIEVDARGEEK